MSTALHGSASELPRPVTIAGVRSTSRRDYHRSTDRLQQAVGTMNSISRALVSTTEGPRQLVQEVVRAAAAHLQAEWMLLALADDALADAQPRFLVLDPDRLEHDRMSALPGPLRRLVRQIREGSDDGTFAEDDGWLRVPLALDGVPIGALAGRHGLADGLDPTDISVLRILANQAALAVHTARLYQSGLALRRRAQSLYEEVRGQARDLSVRTEELRNAERRLHAADLREVLDAERSRIALELHDSVAQTVLSAGLAVDLCGADVGALPGGEDAATRLTDAKELIRRASEQLRSLIFALHHSRTAEGVANLPDLLQEMAAQHRPLFAVSVRVEGRPLPLGTEIEHALARTAGEALFNIAMHAEASKAHVRLHYGRDDVLLCISDDGRGDPAAMRRTLRLAQINQADGRHRGLVGMSRRAAQHGGSLAIRRARLGGVMVSTRLPLPTAATETQPDGQ